MHILVCAVSYKTLTSYMLITWTLTSFILHADNLDISEKGRINQFTALRLQMLHACTLEHSWGPQLVEDLFNIQMNPEFPVKFQGSNVFYDRTYHWQVSIELRPIQRLKGSRCLHSEDVHISAICKIINEGRT